jgi:sec-independent protein translocase protein TatA
MFNPSHTLALIGPIGTMEAVVILILGLLIFGRKLPEVGRSLGRGIVEFRRGLSGIENEISEAAARPSQTSLPKENLTRPPLTEGGEDVRVSRSPEQVPATSEGSGQA